MGAASHSCIPFLGIDVIDAAIDAGKDACTKYRIYCWGNLGSGCLASMAIVCHNNNQPQHCHMQCQGKHSSMLHLQHMLTYINLSIGTTISAGLLCLLLGTCVCIAMFSRQWGCVQSCMQGSGDSFKLQVEWFASEVVPQVEWSGTIP